MKHYINNTTKEVFAYELDGSQDHLISDSLVPITDIDLSTLRNQQEQARLDALTYSDKRKAEYDQLNQFEMQFDDKENSTTTWVDKINEIKGRHPK
tara:strand:- start:39 stop:326 length:288 start_codon:yes stop_codon:yes gene_type:complete